MLHTEQTDENEPEAVLASGSYNKMYVTIASCVETYHSSLTADHVKESNE